MFFTNELCSCASSCDWRLVRAEVCRWSTVFLFCFRLLDTTGVSTTSSKNTVPWEAKRLLHNRRILTNPRHCVTVRGQGVHQLVQLSLAGSQLSMNGISGISAALVTFILTEACRLIATGTSTNRSTYWSFGSFNIDCAV